MKDSSNVKKINLSNTGAVTLPNASVNTAGLVTTEGGISVTDSGAVENINLSNTGTVTKGAISIPDSGAVEKSI